MSNDEYKLKGCSSYTAQKLRRKIKFNSTFFSSSSFLSLSRSLYVCVCLRLSIRGIFNLENMKSTNDIHNFIECYNLVVGIRICENHNSN